MSIVGRLEISLVFSSIAASPGNGLSDQDQLGSTYTDMELQVGIGNGKIGARRGYHDVPHLPCLDQLQLVEAA